MSETTFTPPAEELSVETPKPLLWRVLVRPLEPPQTTEGGIFLTEEIQRNQQFITVVGQIVDMGPRAFVGERWEGMPEIGIGTWVLYGTYGGQRIELTDGRDYLLVNDDQLLGVISDPEMYRKKLV